MGAGMVVVVGKHAGKYRMSWSHVGKYRRIYRVRGEYTDDTRPCRLLGALVWVGSRANT